MAVTASGVYGLTLSKQLQDTLGRDMNSETLVYVLLATDSDTPDFDADDFRADIGSEVTAGSGYTAGGAVMAGTTITVSTNGTLIYDGNDVSWATSTITDAMCAVGYFTTGSSTTDELIWLSDFVTAASSSGGTFQVTWSTGGIIIYDFTPA
jgi:hypothetical protein